MARVSGIKCDYCDKLDTETGDKPPVGWVRLMSAVQTGENDHFDLCSNLCLLELAALRYDGDEGDMATVRKYTQQYHRQLREKKKAGAASNGK